MKTLTLTVKLLCFSCMPLFLIAQEEPLDTAMVHRIRTEGLEHSQVDSIIHYLSDVCGPRLTNSVAYNNAAKWATDAMRQWHLSNINLEPWGEFGKGWDMEDVNISMQSPYYHPLIAYPYAWSNGTNGLLKASVMAVTLADTTRLLNNSLSVAGKIVCITDSVHTIRSGFNPDARRYSDSELRSMKEGFWATRDEIEMMLGVLKLHKKLKALLQSKGAAAIITRDYGGNDGTIHGDAMLDYRRNADPGIPQVVCSLEDFFRIERLLKSHIPVTISMNIKTRFQTDDYSGHNIVAEIPGTDPQLKSELVMLGGHFDSWYAGTGATDNGAGSAVMMEVMRILKTLDIHPRRTIRLVLWGGEEQGLIGSYHYVKNHFGDPATVQLKPDQAKVSAYYNLDNGSGKIRGIFLQENEAVGPIFRKWLEPFADLGASTILPGNTGETDHYTFDRVGIPGFQFIQDPLDYITRTHHTNIDVYDHVSIDDLKQAATIIASFVYHTAMRNEKLPRKALPKPGTWLFDGF